MWLCLVILREPGVVVFGHHEGTWCGFVWSSGRGEGGGVLNILVWWYLVIQRGPGVVFDPPEGSWCGGVWSS